MCIYVYFGCAIPLFLAYYLRILNSRASNRALVLFPFVPQFRAFSSSISFSKFSISFCSTPLQDPKLFDEAKRWFHRTNDLDTIAIYLIK